MTEAGRPKLLKMCVGQMNWLYLFVMLNTCCRRDNANAISGKKFLYFVLIAAVFNLQSAFRLVTALPHALRKGQAISIQALRAPNFNNRRLFDNRYLKMAKLSSLRTGRLYPQGGSLVLISFRG